MTDPRDPTTDPAPPRPEPEELGDARSNDQLTDAVVAGARWITAVRMLAEVVLLVVMVVLARMIPPAEFGKFAIVLLMQELAIAITGGFGNAIVQRQTVRREHLQAGQAIVLGFEVVLALVTFFVLAPLVFEPIFGSDTASLIQLATINLLLIGLAAVPQAVLQRRLDFRRLAQMQFAAVIATAVTSLSLAVFLDLDAEALVLGTTCAAAICMVIAFLSAPVPLPRWHRREARELADYGIPASLAAISWAGFRNADYAIVGARLGAASAGLYWRSFQLAVEYQKKISIIMYQIAFPVLSRAASVEDMYALRLRMVRMLTVLVFPLLAGLVALAPVVIPWVFGPAWESTVLPTQILTIAGAATLVIDAVGATLMANGRARALLGYGWGHFVVYAGAVVVVAPHGLVAVSIAAAGVHVLFLGIAYGVLLHGHLERPLRRLWDDVAPALVSSAALIAVAVPVTAALSAAGLPAPVHLVVVGATATPAYLLVLRYAFPVAWQDLAVLLRRVLPARLHRGGRGVAAASAA